MKLKPVNVARRPDYPTFDGYALRRTREREGSFFRAEVFVAAGVLAIALECGAGDSVQGKGESSHREIRLRGRIAAPARPMPAPEPPVELLGDIAFPSPPVKPEPSNPEETPPVPPDDGCEKAELLCPTTTDKAETSETCVPVESEVPPKLLGRPPIQPQPPKPQGAPVQPLPPRLRGEPIAPRPPVTAEPMEQKTEPAEK